MDYLIDSNKDVSLLRQKGIIKNEIGEDKRVASLFNKIGKGVAISYDFYYKEEYFMLVQHCKKPWNRMKASLRHNYFNSPWAGASTVGAVILLILTAIQTVLAFTVEFIRERCGRKPTEEDIIIPYSCIDGQVRRDLLLLENQLPFFVLTKLHNMTMDQINGGFGGWEGGEPPSRLDLIVPFIKLVKETFNSSFLKMSPTSFLKTEGDAKNIKHLLQLVHMSCHLLEKKTSLTPENPSLEMEYCRKSLCWNPLQMVRLKNMPNDKDHQTWDTNMPNATELREAGVTFSKIGKIYRRLEGYHNLGDNTSLFDIKFENGVMTIPCFEVFDYTETILRNLVAYEQQSSDVHPRYFSDFSIFMDYLIDSNKDVSLLRQKGIIKNEIGEDKRVASLFNKIGKGVAISYDFYYKEEYFMLVQHCKKPWNRMKASLRHNYFNSPWAGASTVGAVILLILTAIQTVLAFTGNVK
ncbi:UPF0481 protein At3g47200-like isoform X1 [Nicotiana tabacum]|uniref:UPF0481 protein At3g47200-like isoform X1 n=1 Tax=Nicotiana tabacum TaxID=4097 RepID=A0AC58SX83_TOBAC